MALINNDLTNNGLELLIQAMQGKPLTFTKIVIGSGTLPTGKTAQTTSDVYEKRATIDITKCKKQSDGSLIVGGYFSNAEIQSEFYFRELALYACGENEQEILFCYGNAGANAELIPASTELLEKNIDIIVAIGNTSNITIVKENSEELNQTIRNSNISLTKSGLLYNSFKSGISHAFTLTTFDKAVGYEVGKGFLNVDTAMVEGYTGECAVTTAKALADTDITRGIVNVEVNQTAADYLTIEVTADGENWQAVENNTAFEFNVAGQSLQIAVDITGADDKAEILGIGGAFA